MKTLRELAEAATKGPWGASTSREGVNWVDGPKGMPVIHWTGFDASDYLPAKSAANAQFIAAANPSAILSILDELDRLRADSARWRYARDYLSIEDIEAWADMGWHTPDEAESLKADAAIDSQIGEGEA